MNSNQANLYDSDDDIRRDYDIVQQIAILQSLKPAKRRHPPPPPIPPRPVIPVETRIRLASEQRHARNESIARRIGTHSYQTRIQSNEEYEQVLQRSLTDYQKPFRGLNNSEMKLIRALSRTVDRKVVNASKSCGICLSEYQLGDRRTILPCMHDYHSACIEKWLSENNTCPICKADVSKQLKNCH